MLGLAASVRFTLVAKQYTGPFKKMKQLAKQKGISPDPRGRGLELMRDLHRQISTNESALLLSQAELAAPKFVSGLRLLLVFFIPAACCLAALKYVYGQ